MVTLLSVYFFYPETRGHTLEQMAVIFDQDAAALPPPAIILGKTEVFHQESIGETEIKGQNVNVNVTIETESVV
jgi:hypothetical protein